MCLQISVNLFYNLFVFDFVYGRFLLLLLATGEKLLPDLRQNKEKQLQRYGRLHQRIQLLVVIDGTKLRR